jgi:hypothetical protein
MLAAVRAAMKAAGIAMDGFGVIATRSHDGGGDDAGRLHR